MSSSAASLTYIDGPTAVIEWRGLLTDHTFDPGGTSYELAGYSLHKTQSPAIEAPAVGHVDAVLLSHAHHVDDQKATRGRTRPGYRRASSRQPIRGREPPRLRATCVSSEIVAGLCLCVSPPWGVTF